MSALCASQCPTPVEQLLLFPASRPIGSSMLQPLLTAPSPLVVRTRPVLNGKKKCSVTQISQKSPRALPVFNHG